MTTDHINDDLALATAIRELAARRKDFQLDDDVITGLAQSMLDDVDWSFESAK